jgi:ADP-heptose:LPS heptosyltransferase
MNLLTKRFESTILFQNGAIGDFLMAIFLAELLQKSGYVDHVTIVVPRNLNFLNGLLGTYPYISAVEVSRRRGWSHLLQRMRRPCLVVLQPTLDKIPVPVKILGWLISRNSGSELIGFQDNGPLCKIFYSKTLVYNTDQLYSVTIQEIVRALGAPVLVEGPNLKITPSLECIKTAGLHHRRYMVFHPGAGVPKRSFTVQAAREVIDHVLKRNPEMHVVLSGGPTERKLIEEIRIGIQKRERLVNAIGCSAKEIAAFIQSAQFFLGTDSGITHLACLLGARVIVAAHSGTATNWLPFYCPTATVLYRLEEEDGVHRDREYLDARRRGRVKPFGMVPMNAIYAALDECLDRRTKQCIGSDV